MKKQFIVKISKNGINIPKERLTGISEGDLAEIQIQKVYADDDFKKTLKFGIAELK